MAAITELIRPESNGALSFGDYTLSQKKKKEDVEFFGDLYKVKTCREITKLEKNGLFTYESVPGTAVKYFKETETGVSFLVEGPQDAEITIGLEPSAEYAISVGGVSAGVVKTNLGGKLSISVELSGKPEVAVKAEKR